MSYIVTSSAPIGKIRSPWGVWWLSLITAGIYYLVWYVKLNKEIARAAGPDVEVGTFGLWFSQCVPIAYWVSLAHTAERLSTAQHRAGTAPTASGGMTFLSSLWFFSQTRYLQRRANQLWRYMETQQSAVASAPSLASHPSAPPTSPSLPAPTGAPVEIDGHGKGHGNGHGNGHGTGYDTGAAEPAATENKHVAAHEAGA
jgi:hypothetical protein